MNNDEMVYNFFKNYQDRGMKKWVGFFLSDHTSKINQADQVLKANYYPKTLMDQAAIGEALLRAYSNQLEVSIQRKTIDQNGNFLADLKGKVAGYVDDQISIAGQLISLSDIRHIEIKEN